jgi:thiol-disulfide isomerase/thioredoxin
LVRRPVRRFASCRSIDETGASRLSAIRTEPHSRGRRRACVRSTMRPVSSRHAIALILVTASAVAACTEDSTDSGPGPRSPVPAGNAATAPLLPADASALPEFDLARFEQLLGQLDGTPVLVNFWGSWCEPCRDEAPHLASAHETYGDRVQFLGVDILDARDGAREFMREYGWTYPSVFDPPAAIRDGLGLLGQPVTLFYDADGDLIDRWVGPIPPDELTHRLTALLTR